MFSDRTQQTELHFHVHTYSSSTPTFTPSHITQEDPTNPSSRWTSTTNDPNQHLTLKLTEEAIVTRITFGKFHKMHVCNLKSFKVYSYKDSSATPICNSEQRPLLVYKGGLRNDAVYETFATRTTYRNTFVVSGYVRIQPTQAWGVNFNFSIWHLKVYGIKRRDLLKSCIMHNVEVLNRECHKVVLRFLKHQNRVKTLECLENELGRCYEPEIKQKMRVLIGEDDFDGLEQLMEGALKDGLVDRQRFERAEWRELPGRGPCERGGHAMVCHKGSIYVHGGWNGHAELGDMWIYDTGRAEWSKVERFEEKRSCHKMIFVEGTDFNKDLQSTKDYINETDNKLVKETGDEQRRDSNDESRHCVNEQRQININRDNRQNVDRENLQNVSRDNSQNVNRDNSQNVNRENRNEQNNIRQSNNVHLNPEQNNIEQINNNHPNSEINGQTNTASSNQSNSHINNMSNDQINNDIDIQSNNNNQMHNRNTTAPRFIINSFDPNMIVKSGARRMERRARKKNFFVSDSFLVTGRYVDKDARDKRIDHFLYSIKDGRTKRCNFDWEVQCIYDHQLVNVNNNIYIFGGRTWITNQLGYGDLYFLKGNDLKKVEFETKNTECLWGRIGHTLLYYENTYTVDIEQKLENNEPLWDSINREVMPRRSLIVVGGIREKYAFKRLTFYNLDTDTVYKNVNYPFDHEGKVMTRCCMIGDEIYVLFCYETGRDGVIDTLLFYKYNIMYDKWRKIECKGKTPVPRAAHTFVFDSSLNRFFMFGGNLGEDDANHRRLNDLWELRIINISTADLMMKIKFTIRKHVFLRLITKDINEALDYLQTKVYEVVNHSSAVEEANFKNLCCEIYKKQPLRSKDEILDDVAMYFVDEIRPSNVNIYESVFL